MDDIIFNRVKDLMIQINNDGGRSHNRVDELQINGDLEKYFEDAKIDNDIRYELVNFITTLFNKDLDRYPLYKKVLLYRNDLLKIFKNFGYEVGAYFWDSDSYHRFTRFIKSACLHYHLNVNFDMLDYYVNKYIGLEKKYDLNRKRHEEDIKLMSKDNSDKYKYYIPYIKNNVINYENKDMFYIYGEYLTMEHELINNKNSDYKPIWVAKDEGDGFGFDILSYDQKTKREKAIEVKTGRYESFTLSDNEYNSIFKLQGFRNVDYYVYKYIFDGSLKQNKYKYDYIRDMFVSVYDYTDTFVLYQAEYWDEKLGCYKKCFKTTRPKEIIRKLEK